jgi:AspT/YidE/YbjL antiporter-like protein
VDHATLAFVKEFGLILFVFTIGLQLGPGFFAAFRRDGLRLNALVVGVVLFGSALAVMLGSLLRMDSAAVLGVLSGASTSTPSLGAAQQALSTQRGVSEQQQALVALAYVVTYPAAIAGIISTLLFLKRVFRIDTKNELETRTADGPNLTRAEQRPGNSTKELDEMHFIPLFMGIALGVIAGTIPIVIPGLPNPVQLGLAGGPLVVALLLGRLGHIGRLVFHVPLNANLAFREFGIALFFAAVGLAAGPSFFSSVFSSAGVMWLVAGLCVTVLPLLLFGFVARLMLKMNFAVLGGVLAGSVTDPPALAFINNLTKSDAPTLAYVTVYPLTTVLRVLAAQVLAVMLVSLGTASAIVSPRRTAA